jgi:AcrR family transcriptional regulator
MTSPDIVEQGRSSAAPSATKPHRARRGEGDRLREQILDATEVLLVGGTDPNHISIRAVARAVDRTPPSIYLHFATKDELIQAVCRRQFESMTGRFRAALDGIDDPVDRIRCMARVYVEFALTHPEQYRVLFMSGLRTEAHDLDQLRLTDCYAMLHCAVEDALDHHDFASGDPDLIALGLWTAIHGVASLLIAHDLEFPPVDAYLGQVLEQNLSGLLAR